MEKISMSLALYKNNICFLNTEEDIKEFNRINKEATKLFKYFSKKTCCLEEVVKNILYSYKLTKKQIGFENRINYIKGIIYSRHFVDYDDVTSFLEQIDLYNATDFSEETICKSVNYSGSIENDWVSYLTDEAIGLSDSVSPLNIQITFDEEVFSEEEEEEEDEAEIKTINREMEEDFIDEDSINVPLSPAEKLDFLRESFDSYCDKVLNNKEITDIKEAKYVIRGMNDWFNRVYGYMSNLYELNENMKKLNDPTLLKTL